MGVGQDNANQVFLAFLDEFQIGKDQLGARVFVGPKSHPQVNHQPLAVAAVQVDVHPDFARSAERAEQQFLAGLHDSIVRLA